MKKLLLFLLLIHVIILPQGITYNQSNSWHNFNSKYQNKWTIKWNNDQSSPAVIYGHKTKKFSNGSEIAAKTLMNEMTDIFLKDSVKFKIKHLKTKKLNSDNQVEFIQNYKNIPVYNSSVSVFVNEVCEITFIASNLFNNFEIGNIEVITKEEAKQIASNTTGISNAVFKQEDKMIYVNDDIGRYAWVFRLYSNTPEAYLCIIDAENGALIEKQNLIETVTGKVNYYPKDPVNSTLLTIQDAYRLDGTGYIRGEYADVTTQLTSRAYQKYSYFVYSTPDPHFHEGNVYWHVDNIAANYFNSTLLYHMDQVGALIYNGAMAYFDTENNRLLLGSDADTIDYDHTLYRVPTLKNDIIYHEYSHAVAFHIGLQYTTAEVQARNEGYADYFTCSFTNDYLFGEWYAFSIPYMRIVNNSSSVFNYKNWNNINFYNDYNLPCHLNGMIWSGACWDLRNALGQTIADKIIFKGLLNASGTFDFETAMYGIISADIQEYSGTHIGTINTIFNNRCILHPSAPVGLNISGSVGQNPTVSWARNTEPDISGYEVYRSLNGYTYQLEQIIRKPFITYYTDLASTIGVPGDPTVCYKIKAVDKYGNKSDLSSAACTYDGGLSKQSELKKDLSFKLDEAYPNPFNPTAKLSFQIPENASVKLEIFNSIGQKVYDLADGIFEPGSYNFNFDGSKIAGGIYYARFTAIGSSNGKVFVKTNKLVLIK